MTALLHVSNAGHAAASAQLSSLPFPDCFPLFHPVFYVRFRAFESHQRAQPTLIPFRCAAVRGLSLP